MHIAPTHQKSFLSSIPNGPSRIPGDVVFENRIDVALSLLRIQSAFPWDTAPKYLLRDRDGVFEEDFARRVESMA